MLKARHGGNDDVSAWQPPVVSLNAAGAEGIERLSDAIGRHLGWLEDSGHFDSHRLAMQRIQLGQRIWRELRSRLEQRRTGDADQLTHWAKQILSAEAGMDEAVKAILDGGERVQAAPKPAGQNENRPDHRIRRRLET